MALAVEEVNQLETYDPTDFNNTATFEPASPLCITRVYQHKDETYSASGSQPRKHFIKTSWQTQAEKIMEVLNEFGDNDARRVWISDTLSADMNFSLPAGMSTPDNTLQVFVIGESLPCFVVTLYNALEKNANPGDQKEHIHKFTVSTIKRLKSSLLNFCHDEFAILPCTLDMQNFDAKSLKQELQMREDKCQQFYDGPIRLETTVFNNLAQAAVLQRGTSCVPCFMPTSFKGCDTDEEWLILLDEKWRNIVQLLIVAMTHTGQSSVRIPCRSALKMEVAILETACRVGRSQLVTIKSSNAEVNDCVTKLITKKKCKAKLEQSGEIDGSFQVISQQSTITFKEIKGIATVTCTSYQDSTPVEVWMDGNSKIETAVTLTVSKEMTSVEDESEAEIDERDNFKDKGVATVIAANEESGSTEDAVERDDTEKNTVEEIRTAVTLPVSKEMTSVEDESEAKIDERDNFKDKGVATVTDVIEDSGWTEDAVKRDDHTEKNSIEEVETVTGPAENIKTTHGRPETRDTHKKNAYQTTYSNLCKIVGLPESNCKESKKDLIEKARQFFFELLGLPVQREVILSAKRLEGKTLPREVCVVFSSTKARNTVLNTGSKLAGYYPYTEEFLPTVKHHLLLEARSRFGFECAWSENGVVLVKMHDGVIVEVDSVDHLDDIRRQNFGIRCYFDYNQAAPGPQRTTRSAQYSPPHQNDCHWQMFQRHPVSPRAESFSQNTNRSGIC